MTTRHVSAENDYPFVPVLDTGDAAAVGGILDLYFVVQGQPTGFEEGSSSSSGEEEELERVHEIHLVSYSVSGPVTTYTFEAQENNEIWEITFDVPNTAADTGQVYNTDSTSCRAVLVFNSDTVVDAGSASVHIKVEPARAQWHTESVDSLNFLNIYRCNGVEDPDIEIGLPSSGSSGADLAWTDVVRLDMPVGPQDLTASVSDVNGYLTVSDPDDGDSHSSHGH